MGRNENLISEYLCLGGGKDQFEFLQVRKKLDGRNILSKCCKYGVEE